MVATASHASCFLLDHKWQGTVVVLSEHHSNAGRKCQMLDAQVAFEAFKSNMIQPEKSVASQLDGQRAEQLRKNQELIKSVAKKRKIFAENRALLFGVIKTTAQRPPRATEATSESSWISVLRLVTSICKTTLNQGKEMPCTAARRSKINSLR